MKFNITLSPQYRDDTLEIEKQNDTLIINNEEYDFSPLEDGASISAEAVGNPFIVSDVYRLGDTISLKMILPNTTNSSESARFPEPILIEKDGKVVLPE